MRTIAAAVICLACASHGRRVGSVQSRSEKESATSQSDQLGALSRLLVASSPDAGWQVTGTGFRGNLAKNKPLFNAHRTATTRMQEEATLEDQLKEGLITQEEYDMLSSAVSEEEFLAAGGVEADEPELSAEAKIEASRMVSGSGVEWAPWMKIDAEAVASAKKERAARQAAAAAAKENQRTEILELDAQGAEVGALAGLKTKILSEEEVELRWDTTKLSEGNNLGYIVQRRRGRTDDWETLASHEGNDMLKSKGAGGGLYYYLDDTATIATWIYRIVDENEKGRAVICQKMVEIESKDEVLGQYIITAIVAALFIIAVVGSNTFDGNVLN